MIVENGWMKLPMTPSLVPQPGPGTRYPLALDFREGDPQALVPRGCNGHQI